jgi:hypothetical protein
MSEAASFKAGDCVVCVKDIWPFEEGRSYEVATEERFSGTEGLNLVRLIAPHRPQGRYYVPAAALRTFEAGDRVRIRSHEIWGMAGCYTSIRECPIGSVHTVAAAPDDEGDCFLSGVFTYVHTHNLELESEPTSVAEPPSEAAPAEAFAQLGEIAAIFIATLGPNARLVLLDIAQRLERGAKQYGDFDMQRDWSHEAREEDLDGIVYRTVRSIREGRS